VNQNYQQRYPSQPQYQQQNQYQQSNQYQTNNFSQAKSTQMSDRDRINDMLATEKHLTDAYNVFVREASHRELYQDTLQILNNTHQSARDLFNEMYSQGWYNVQAETAQEVAKVQQKFSNYQTQLPNTNSFQTYQNQIY